MKNFIGMKRETFEKVELTLICAFAIIMALCFLRDIANEEARMGTVINKAGLDVAELTPVTYYNGVESDHLVYDDETKIVYYYFTISYKRSTAGYMSPYIGKNGKFCRYVDGKIVEVE